jgi:hypothetical protein
MIQSVFTIAIILVVVAVAVSVILLKATPNEKFIGYFPNFIFMAAGLVLLLIATYDKIEVMGAGLGGWGIACLFAGAIGSVITSVVDSFTNANA